MNIYLYFRINVSYALASTKQMSFFSLPVMYISASLCDCGLASYWIHLLNLLLRKFKSAYWEIEWIWKQKQLQQR